MLEQVTVKDQASAVVDSPLTVLTDPDRLDQVFAVQEAGQNGDMALLELRALSPETEFEFILLGLRADELALMIMEDAFGLRTELRFERIERNPPIDPSLFTFEPPPGVDVIGDASVLSPGGP
jgi:outer membrane lipoprotein carrier protein